MRRREASQMFAVSLLVFGFLATSIVCVSSLTCYESSCFSLPSGVSLGSCRQREISCTQYSMDRCMTIRATINASDRLIMQEVRNCTNAVACIMPREICKAGNKTGNIRKCQLGCCQGDLCNNSTTFDAKETTLPYGPTGGELSCYSCSSTTTDSQSTNKCKNFAIQRCDRSRMTGLVQDRCMAITVKAGSITQELRNCSDAVYCTGNSYCQSANRSYEGTLTHCKVSCCYGNLCNTDVNSFMSLGNVPTTSYVTELLATVSTRVNDTVESHVLSRGNNNSGLFESTMIVLIVLMLFS